MALKLASRQGHQRFIALVFGHWVNLDPVIRHLRSQFRSLPIEDYLVGLLPGHVAINAIFRKRMPWSGEGCRFRFVAAKAALRKLGHVVLRSMNIVAGEAMHTFNNSVKIWE